MTTLKYLEETYFENNQDKLNNLMLLLNLTNQIKEVEK